MWWCFFVVTLVVPAKSKRNGAKEKQNITSRMTMMQDHGWDPRNHWESEEINHPFIDAVKNNNLDKVKFMINSDESLNEEKVNGVPLLTLSLKHAFDYRQWEIFEYLLQQNVDLDLLINKIRRDFFFISLPQEPYYLALFDKGVNINVHNYEAGNTFLHQAIPDCSVMFGQALIEKGADVNADNNLGETPLFIACQYDSIDWVHMLLYNGAIATIPTHKGRLPLTVVIEEELLPLLFDHTFDEDCIKIPLAALVDDMTRHSFLVDRVSEVIYSFEDLEHLEDNLSSIGVAGLSFFFRKFRWIIRDLVDYCIPWEKILLEGYNDGPFNTCLEGILKMFLESEFVDQCVQKLPKKPFSLRLLIGAMCAEFMDLEKITKIVCIFLSYGAEVTSRDLDQVYDMYGYCELFKILLHMDIRVLGRWNVMEPHSDAILYYKVDTDLDKLLKKLPLNIELLGYFNRQSLKKNDVFLERIWDENMYITIWCKEKISKIEAKLRSLPTVPLLIELSRDAARKFIVNRFKVKNSKQFYTILNWLPIDNHTRQIIALEKKLY